MTADLFAYYLKHIWYPAVRPRTSANVCMILDNCSAHGDELPVLSGVEYIFLPPNVTSVYQPMDQGPIAAVKKVARAALLRIIVATLPSRAELRELGKKKKRGTEGLDFGFPAHVLDAINCIRDGMMSLTPQKVFNCWVRSGLLSKKQIGTVCHRFGMEPPKKYAQTPGIRAEAKRTSEDVETLQLPSTRSLSNDLLGETTELVQNCAVGHVEKDVDEYFDILGVLHAEQAQDGEELRSVRDLLGSWLDEVDGLEQSKTDALHKEKEAILSEMDQLQTVLDRENEDDEQGHRSADAAVDVVEQHSTYEKRKMDDAWIRNVLKEAEEREIDEAVLCKLIGGVRLSRQQVKAAEPETNQSLMGDFFAMKG